jgi:uncharacterized protein (DUF362 family)
MNRREFLSLAALTGLGLSLPNKIGNLVNTAEAAVKDTISGNMPDIVIAHGASPSKITVAAINALGTINKFISKGDVVVVKPNMGWDRQPEYAANTNPEVVATVVKLCFDAGAKKVKVFDRPVNDPRRCYVQSGIMDAVKPLGADIGYVDERKFKDVTIKGNVLKSWPLYTDILEADKIINIPIAKHHSLGKVTMAMKNWMGVMGGRRNSIHQRLDESLADLALVIKPTLTILDAVRILTANGPSGGSLADVKKLDTVIVGVDQVAIDSYGATLFGLKGSDLGYVVAADKMGIGKMDISKLKIKKISV